MSDGLWIISSAALFNQHYPTSFVSSLLVVSDERQTKKKTKKTPQQTKPNQKRADMGNELCSHSYKKERGDNFSKKGKKG